MACGGGGGDGGGGGNDANRCGGGASRRRTPKQMSQARHLHIAQCRSRVFGLATCSVQKAAQPSTELSPATAELQRWGDGDGGGGGGGRGGGGETQWAHAAHLPASDREVRALVARAVHVQGRLEFEPLITEGAAVRRLAEALARPLRKVTVALRRASVRVRRHKGLHDSRRAGPLSWHGDGCRSRRRREDRFLARAEAARLALAALAVALHVRKRRRLDQTARASAGGAKRVGQGRAPASHTCCVAVLSFSRHQLAQPSTFASPATLEVQVRGGGGRAGGGGGGGEVHTGHARHLHQLPQ